MTELVGFVRDVDVHTDTHHVQDMNGDARSIAGRRRVSVRAELTEYTEAQLRQLASGAARIRIEFVEDVPATQEFTITESPLRGSW